MPTTHVLTNAHGNTWHLTTPQGQVLDSVIAPNHTEAALAFQHLVPRDGVWETVEGGQYAYRAMGRSGGVSPCGSPLIAGATRASPTRSGDSPC